MAVTDDITVFEPGDDIPAEKKRFNLKPKHRPQWEGPMFPVYYRPEAEPEDVIRTWLSANENVVDKLDEWRIHMRIARQYSKEWKEASHEILGPFDVEQTSMGGVCEFCGEEYNHSLARHLPCDT